MGGFKKKICYCICNSFNFIFIPELFSYLPCEQIIEELGNKNKIERIAYAIAYLFIKPSHWLLTTYLRHKGFMDSWQGFVFSFFSALRFPVSFIVYLTSKS